MRTLNIRVSLGFSSSFNWEALFWTILDDYGNKVIGLK